MTEARQRPSDAQLPPGILSSERYLEGFPIDGSTLPWVQEPHPISIVRCGVGDNTEFLLANVVGSHSRLIRAADALTGHQTDIVNNMFYSRIAAFAQHGPGATSIDTMPDPVTPFPIHVMRNRGGQRVYFGAPLLPVGEHGETMPVVLRLGVCDKNEQALVMKVLSGASVRSMRQKSGR